MFNKSFGLVVSCSLFYFHEGIACGCTYNAMVKHLELIMIYIVVDF